MAMHALTTALYLLAASLAALAFYLATAHQRLRPGWRRHARALRMAGALLSTLALVAAIAVLGVWAGTFAALSALMLAAVALPFLDAWRQLGGGRRDVG
ncbi:hypothetical protein RMA73_12025 [Xanthomonas translucens pv. translucens]|uniref:hypothetical protein n=1 Tax=Xanthomonas campestris pv. translucens TaxID=343 RepID=UPI000A6E0C63|nr:hypothetical protein [Xanthomonas translucens]MCS3360366.1 hypothetical protein [Xanthomonas translucens pv. translucens]MCS3374210.1 hypothetical protein [Xanthomonas translucens pv. translucens]MCT8289900.1 hypothetical protein [Xanthomonas translucens pv. translucens]MCT8293623.1 hypothetical protein [Xanthomonas translucens pv. translucens]MCT8307947.1 hypothetical protein [Xanthomonas translucens pv. translucens]